MALTSACTLCSVLLMFVVFTPKIVHATPTLFPIANQTQTAVFQNVWHFPFSLRVHHNYSTTSSAFHPDFEQNPQHVAFAEHRIHRARRQTMGNRRDPEEGVESYFFEGDILNQDPQQASGDTDAGLAYAAVRNVAQRWAVGPHGMAIVPYKFHNSLRERVRGVIRDVMKEFEKVCVVWQEQTAADKVYVEIRNPGGPACAATIGKRTGEANLVYLHEACVTEKGKVMHELMHVLGFYHEQSRDDRDQYVSIHWEHIQERAKNNFKAYSAVDVDHLGYEYDYNSLMHYPSTAFATDGQSVTVEALRPLPAGVELGQRVTFSKSDLGKLRALFKCGLRCDTKTQFKCADGTQCIDIKQKCDGTTNCPDGSDEKDCKPKCNGQQFACPTKCIPRSWFCDGTRDCSDGSDEPARGCPVTCDSSQFRCQKDGICIENYKKCNGQNDCSDGEDESAKNCPAPPRQAPQPQANQQRPQQTVGDLCSIPQYYSQYYQYCFFNYRQRRFNQQNPYFDFLNNFAFDPIVAGVVNFACGLPVNAIDNPQVKLDFDYIMENELCNNLIIHSSIIKNTNNAPQVTLPSHADKFVRTLRAKVKALEAKKKANGGKGPRKMEIYLGIGGRGTTRTLSDWVAQGPAQTEKFANASRAYARALDVDGIVLDWRSNALGPLLTLVRQLEKAVRTDPAKSAATIDLLMGVIMTDGLVKAQNDNKVALADLTNAVDYVMYVPSTQGEARDYDYLGPNNKFFLDTLQSGLPLKLGGPGGSANEISSLSKKFFLPFHLGAKQYAANPDETNNFDAYALGPSFGGTVSIDPGRLTAGEACAKFNKPDYTKETRDYFEGELALHEPVAFRAAKDFASYETPCSVAQKIQFFQKKYKPGGKDNSPQLYAGIYVPDISLDDTKASCAAQALPYSLLSVVAQANHNLDIQAMTDECDRKTDFSWKTPLTASIKESLKDKKSDGDNSSKGGDSVALPPGLASDTI